MTTKEQNMETDVEWERYDRFGEFMESLAYPRLDHLHYCDIEVVRDVLREEREEFTKRRKAIIKYLKFRRIVVTKAICWIH